MTTTTTTPTAMDLLWAVHNPSQAQRKALQGLPVTANAVLVTVASAAVLMDLDHRVDQMVTDQGNVIWSSKSASVPLNTAAYVARTLGISEATVKGHLKNLVAQGLVTATQHPIYATYKANGQVILANLDQRRG